MAMLMQHCVLCSTDSTSEEAAEEESVHACEGDDLRIECQADDEVIRIIRANFGRFSIAVCNEDVRTNISVNCFSPESTQIVSQR